MFPPSTFLLVISGRIERGHSMQNSNVKQCIEFSFEKEIRTIMENTEINYKLIEYTIKIKKNEKRK